MVEHAILAVDGEAVVIDQPFFDIEYWYECCNLCLDYSFNNPPCVGWIFSSSVQACTLKLTYGELTYEESPGDPVSTNKRYAGLLRDSPISTIAPSQMPSLSFPSTFQTKKHDLSLLQSIFPFIP